MSEKLTYNLKALRDSNEASFLWDIDRSRVVWANSAGTKLFEAFSLFDLIDRPFDKNEAGVQVLRALNGKLVPGQIQHEKLAFPSVGIREAIWFSCQSYDLADGRQGVLIVNQLKVEVTNKLHIDDLMTAFMAVPSPVVLFAHDGKVALMNSAAEDLLIEDANYSVENLLDGTKLRDSFRRLSDVNVVSVAGSARGRVGKRDLLVTLRRIHDSDSIFATAILEDVTDRRALELVATDELTDTPVNRLNQQTAFEQVGISIKKQISESKSPLERAVSRRVRSGIPKVDIDERAGRLPAIPDTIKLSMEKSGEAVVIAQKGKAVFATEKVAELMGYTSVGEMLTDGDAIQSILALEDHKAEIKISKRNSDQIFVEVISTSIPWLHGPARQFRIKQIARPSNTPTLNATELEDINTQKSEDSVRSNSNPRADIIEKIIPPVVQREFVDPATAELKAILDVVNDGIVTLDQESRILSFSAGAESITGQRQRDVIGRPFTDLLNAESRKVVVDYLAAMLGPGVASVFNDGREVHANVKEGGITPLFLTIGRLQAQQSDAAFCVVFRDITQWKTTEAELREAKENAERTSRQKTEFLARMGHELRTPINAIMGFSDLMRQDNGRAFRTDRYLSYAQDIHVSASHLLSLINDLLDLSKVEAGRMDLSFTAVSVVDAANYAVRMLGQEALQRGVILRQAMTDKLPRVVADLRAMRQIMINMISNAVKYTDAGGEVTISGNVNKSGALQIKIRDNGIGMSEEQVAVALEPFRRVETEGRETGGTGLGLPLTKALIEANRAQFEISSEEGKGTVVEITFPTTRVLAE